MRRRKSNVIKYRRPMRLNIGVIIFLFIFIYIIIITMTFINHKKISFYEVTEKKIADDNTCQGIILRKEELFNTPISGYVNYFAGDGKRVSKGSTIFSVDSKGNVYDIIANKEQENKITTEECSNIRTNIASFKKNYSDSSYNQVSSFQYDINNTVMELTNVNMLENLETLLKESNTGNSLNIVKTKKAGVVTYSMDGYEKLKAEDITLDTFKKEEYTRNQLRTNKMVETGTPAYKLITDENWSVVLSLSEEQYNKLKERELLQIQNGNTKAYTTITFVKDGLRTRSAYILFTKGDGYFAKLDFSKYMIHYINDRFVEIELSLNSAKGLKIPKSSIIEKSFLKIPLIYFTMGGEDKNRNGLVKETYSKNGDIEYKFVPSEIFFSDNKNAYIDTEDIIINDWIYNEKTKERYQVTKTGTLEGVYNVNKGYAIFRRIEKVYENEEYCIVKKESSYGLSAYDHIVVDASSIEEKAIIK